MADAHPRRHERRSLGSKSSPNAGGTIPPELTIHILTADILLVLSICSAKYWLLARGVGSLWLSINVLAGAGLGAVVLLALRERVAVRGLFPWKTVGLAGGLVFMQQIALFYSLKRLEASRVLFVAPFISSVVLQFTRTHSARILVLTAISVIIAATIDVLTSGNDTATDLKAYLGLAVYGSLTSISTYIEGHLAPSFESPSVGRLIAILCAAIMTIPIHLLGRTIGLLPPYPYVPLLALTPLPLLAFVLHYYHPHMISKGTIHSQRTVFQLTYIPTAAITCIVTPLFSRTLSVAEVPLALLFYYTQRPPAPRAPGSAGMGKSASEPFFRLLQSYLNTILSNQESRKIFYFLLVNLAYMLVQMLYGVWTNSLGLISDAIHMAFDCMAIAMGLFASVMATWKPNERFTYGYSRIETLSGFANGIFLILISLFIIVEAIQRLLDPPQMNTRQLLLVSTGGLAVNLFGMFAMGGHHHHGHSHSHGGHSHGGSSAAHDSHSHESPHGHSHDSPHGHSHDSSSHGHSHAEEQCSDSEHHHSHSHGHSHGSPQEETFQFHTHDHEESHSHSHSHSHEDHGHSHLHFRPNAPGSHSVDTPDIRLESPKGGQFRVLDSSGPNSSLPITPITPASLPFSPLTPSYSFTHDPHLQAHHPEAHSHDHSHSHEGHSHNMRGVFLHVMADTLGSVGVIISTILIKIYGWTGFDPIASMFIAILIAVSVFPLVMDTGKVLALDLDGKETDVERALRELSGIHGVQSYTQAQFWPLEQSKLVGSIHIQITPGLVGGTVQGNGEHYHGLSKLDRVREEVEHILKSRIKGLDELVIQLDG